MHNNMYNMYNMYTQQHVHVHVHVTCTCNGWLDSVRKSLMDGTRPPRQRQGSDPVEAPERQGMRWPLPVPGPVQLHPGLPYP